MTHDFQQCGILKSVDSDEHVQPHFMLRTSKRCSVSSLTLIKYSSVKQRLCSDCAYAQADLSLCWSHIPHCWKSHALAHIDGDSARQIIKITCEITQRSQIRLCICMTRSQPLFCIHLWDNCIHRTLR